jgi:hypothetical protein
MSMNDPKNPVPAPLERGSDSGLYRLLAWLSPGFPIGSFAFSHGLEAAAASGAVRDRDSLQLWLSAILEEAVAGAVQHRKEHDGARSEELNQCLAGFREPIPRVLITAYSDGRFGSALSRQLSKPFEEDELLAASAGL